jgi:N-methylhydantoinase A
VELDAAAAERAIAGLADNVGMTPIDLAAGILRISNSQMADLARKVTVERGLDPRSFLLFGYGGAGPVFSAFLMRELGSRQAYVPADSGVFSAFGMLTTDIVFQEERSTTLRTPLNPANVESINTLYAELKSRLLQRFEQTGLDSKAVRLRRAIDMRFGMQVHELDVDVKDGTLTLADMEQTVSDFIAKYEATYGQDSAYTAAGIEFVTFRITGTIAMERPRLAGLDEAHSASTSLIGRRRCYFAPHGYVEAEIHGGDRVHNGQIIAGPAIVQRPGDTVVLPPGARAKADNYGGLTITWNETAP